MPRPNQALQKSRLAIIDTQVKEDALYKWVVGLVSL
jgi:hypothetical protein